MSLLFAALVIMSQVDAELPRTYLAGDGCNTCTDLGNGLAECTLKACFAKPLVVFTNTSPYTQADAGSDAGVSIASPLTQLYATCPAVEFADGGTAPFAFPVERMGSFINELPPDAGAKSDWYSPYPRGQRAACRIGACEERVVELEQWGRSLQLPAWVAISAFITGAALGVWGAYEVCTRIPVLCGGH